MTTSSESLLAIEDLTGFTHEYVTKRNKVVRRVNVGGDLSEAAYSTRAKLKSSCTNQFETFWRHYLRVGRPEALQEPDRLPVTKTVADLFCGVGGLTQGFAEAMRGLGYQPSVQLGVDVDAAALEVYKANHNAKRILTKSVGEFIDFRTTGECETAKFAYQPELTNIEEFPQGLDFLLGGPPCQGHSTLNNYTRSDDPKNRLYLAMAALAVASGARNIVMENVPNVVNDKSGVVQSAIQLLRGSGYAIETGIMAADALGWPQTRKRFFLVASNEVKPLPLSLVAETLACEPTSLEWCIEDLVDALRPGFVMDDVPEMSEANRKRVDWLFDNDAFDLPNHQRPDCHKDGHTYPSVYGRMHWNQPASTITGGFLTPGRGRYVHPKRRRVLTPHEAARIQGFPDWFSFRPIDRDPTRAELTKWIGDAVPPILGYAIALSLLVPLRRATS
jgi:DNA (cytosine-5)-methyltransferase 1